MDPLISIIVVFFGGQWNISSSNIIMHHLSMHVSEAWGISLDVEVY